MADQVDGDQLVEGDFSGTGGKKMVEAGDLAGCAGKEHRKSVAEGGPDSAVAVLHPALYVFGTDEGDYSGYVGGAVVYGLMSGVEAGSEDQSALIQYRGGQQGKSSSGRAAVPYCLVGVFDCIDFQRSACRGLRDDRADPGAEPTLNASALIYGRVQKPFGTFFHGNAASWACRRAGCTSAAVVRVGDGDMSYFSHK